MPKPRLLDQVQQVIHMKHMSPRTEESYLYYIKQNDTLPKTRCEGP